MISYVQSLLTSATPLPLLAWALAFFLAIYGFFAGAAWLLSKWIRRPLETRPVMATQMRSEILRSMRSIALFGAGMIVPWAMIRLDITRIEEAAMAGQILVECLALIVWNDIHFYAAHRWLHARLKQVHLAHHRSVAATPFAAYSMRATEAMLLGSVMPLAMLVHDFSIQALLFLPVWSIFINTLAHSNCDLFPGASEHSLLSLARHHQAHHSRYHGNYSFFFSHLDRWLGTSSSHPPKQF